MSTRVNSYLTYKSCQHKKLTLDNFHVVRTLSLCFLYREKRFKEEIEQYRQERPKIQQQFSDLKV